MSRKFFLALEEEGVVGEEVPADDLLESQADVGEAHGEVEEAAEDVAELQEAAEEGVEASDTLVDLGGTVEEKVTDGEGLSEDAAKIAEITIESIRVRLGLPKQLGRIPSLENFKSPRSRVEASKVALESIGDTIKKIWEKIKAIAARIWESIRVFIANLFKNYDRLKSHLEALKSKASAATGKPEKKELENGSLAKAFSVDGTASLKTHTEVGENVQNLINIANKAGAAIINSVTKLQQDDAEASKEAAAKVWNIIIDNGGTKQSEKKEGELTVATYKGFPNSTSLVVSGSYTESMLNVSFKSEKAADKIEALTKEQIVAVLTAAIASTEKGKDLKRNAEATEKVLKAAQSYADKTIKAFDHARGDKAKPEESKKTSKAVSSFIRVGAFFSSKVPAAHFSYLKHTGDYAAASLHNLKKEEAKK